EGESDIVFIRPDPLMLDHLEEDVDNIRGALAWLDRTGNDDAFARLASSLGDFWIANGRAGEGRHNLERALAKRDGVSSDALTRTLFWAGTPATYQGDYPDAVAYLHTALSRWRDEADRSGTYAALSSLAILAEFQGD